MKQRLNDDTIHDLQTPLTVIKAQAQMIERWFRRNDIPDAEIVLARLSVIDAMVTRLVAEMDQRRASRPRLVHPPDRTRRS